MRKVGTIFMLLIAFTLPVRVYATTDNISSLEKILSSKTNLSYKLKTIDLIQDWVSEKGNYQNAQKITLNGDSKKLIYNTVYIKPVHEKAFNLSGIVINGDLDNPPTKQMSFNSSNITFANFKNAITNNGGKVTLKNVDFIKNISETNGGAINNYGSLNISGTKTNYTNFYKNSSADKGGAIYNNGNLTLKYALIGGRHYEHKYYIMDSSNHTLATQQDDGTYLYTDSSSVKEQNSTNGSYEWGDDFICIYGLIPELLKQTPISDTHFATVYSLGNNSILGGGLYNDKTASISYTTFMNNTATDGGGIYNNGKLSIKSSVFNSNNAEKGGAIYTKEDNPDLKIKTTVSKSKFLQNTAKNGGALYIDSGNITLKNNNFGSTYDGGNKAEIAGGAIFNQGNNSLIISSNFYGNNAKQGGDIYNSGNLKIQKSYFGYVPKQKVIYVYARPLYITGENFIPYTTKSSQVVDIYFPFTQYSVEPVLKGSSAQQGGAIYNIGTAEIISSKFTENRATEGGSIYNDSQGILKIKKSAFTSNRVDDTENNVFGGVIYNKGYAEIKTSTFKSNFANNGYGGAISNTSGKSVITDSTFNGNYAEYGGAVYNDAEMEIKSSTFINNSAKKSEDDTVIKSNGGAIFNAENGDLTIENVTFGNKKKKYKYSNTADKGSALYNIGKTDLINSKIFYQTSNNGAVFNNNILTIKKSSLLSNSSNVGGAIYNAENGNTTINGSTFKSNLAAAGGAIYTDGNLTIDRLEYQYKKNKKLKTGYISQTFTSNTATEIGGAIYTSDKSNTTINHTTFKSNKAYSATTKQGTEENVTITTPQGAGGAIYIGEKYQNSEDDTRDIGKTTIENSTFTSNSAGLKGGAITIETSGNLEITNSTFNKNNSYTAITTKTTTKSGKKTKTTTSKTYQGYGGAIFAGENTQLKINDSTFKNNYSNQGGALYIDNDNSEIKTSTFTSNKAKGAKGYFGYGGAIYLAEGHTANISGSSFNKNTSYEGGAIYVDKNGFININENSKFISNTATTAGGAIYISSYTPPKQETPDNETTTNTDENSDTTQPDSSDTNNDTDNNNNDTTQSDTNTDNENETPTTDSTTPNPMVFKNITFEKNKASEGGAIFNAGYLSIENGTFKQNTASAGGAIDNYGYLTISSSIFDLNKATYGGDILNNGELTVINTTFNNTKKYVSAAGGAIYNGYKATISGSKFNKNLAVMGGAIYNATQTFYYGTINSEGNEYNQNQSQEGGAIYNSGKLISKQDTFYKNISTYGGAILTLATAEIDSSNFKENQGGQGGAIYNSSNLTLKNGSFESNSGLYGGAVYSANSNTSKDKNGNLIFKSTLTIDGTTFNKNNGKIEAGAIYLLGCSAKIENAKFIENKTDMYGGAIKADKENNLLSINSTEFNSNTATKDGGAIYNESTLNINIKEKANTENDSTQSSTEPENPENTNNSDNTDENNSNEEPTDTEDSETTQEYSTTKFISNKAQYGGGICNSGSANIDKVLFDHNSATNGGAIYNESLLTIGEAIIEDDAFIEDKKARINEFNSNSANTGGAIYNEYISNIYNSKFNENKALNNGGAVYSTARTLVVNSSFNNNSAKNGGAIYQTSNQAKLIIVVSDFTNNNVTGNGGAIFINKNSTEHETEIYSSKFENNRAVKGGAIYFSTNTYGNITDTNFINNHATENGGAIYADKNSTLTITDSSFINNIADKNGGAIYADTNSTVDIISKNSDIYISGNKAGTNSNAVHLNKATLNLKANNETKIQFDDKISGNGTVTTSGNVIFDKNTQIETGSKITFNALSGTLSIQNETSLNSASLSMSGAKLNIANGGIAKLSLSSIELSDTTTDMSIDMDLKNGTSDKIVADSVEGTGTLNVSNVNLTSDSKKAVTINVGEDSLVSSVSAKTASTKLAKYKLKSSIDPQTGLKTVCDGSPGSGTIRRVFNPDKFL